MLFDLRGRGRRRTVRVIYVGLALLMGSGLVLFGIGSFGGSGVLSNLSGNEGTGGSSFSGQIKKYQKITREQPSNASAWEQLTKAMLREANGEAYVNASGEVTGKGKALYGQAAQAWSTYLALDPSNPNPELALLMRNVYSPLGLNEPAKAVQILQLVVAAKPNVAAYYAELAEYAYKAKNVRVGDLASEKAVSLAPTSEKARLKTELAEFKANPSGEKIYTTTTNGKTYTGTLNAKKELQATEVKSTSTPSTTSTSTTTSSKKK